MTMTNTNRIILGLGLGLVLGTVTALAQATLPTEVQSMVDTADATWTAVKAIVAGVVLFGIGLFFVKKVKRG